MPIQVIDPNAKITPRDQALSRLAIRHLIKGEPLPSAVEAGDKGATDTVAFLDTFAKDQRPASQAVMLDFEGEAEPTVAELAANMRAAILQAVRPAPKVSPRDVMLERLARARRRGEALPATVAVEGLFIPTHTFLTGFERDQRPAWPSLAEHVEHVQTPTVGEAAAQLA